MNKKKPRNSNFELWPPPTHTRVCARAHLNKENKQKSKYNQEEYFLIII